MKRTPKVRSPGSRGFTVMELLVASAVSLTVLTVTLMVFVNLLRSWKGIEQRMKADSDVNIAMSRMVYGMNDRLGLRSAAIVTLTTNSANWTLSYTTGGSTPQSNSFAYSVSSSNLVFNPGSLVAGRNISYAKVIAGTQSLVVTLRVDRADGVLKVRREIGTEISFRNL